MKQTFNRCVFIVLMFSSAVPGRQNIQPRAIPTHPSKIIYDSLSWEVPLGLPFRETLDNGCIAYIAEDSTLPLVRLTIYLRYGSLADPPGKEGLSSLCGTMMRTGGTQKYPADTLDEIIDLLALNFKFTTNESQFAFTASFLAEYTDNALELIREMLFHPVFDPKKLDKERTIMIESIRHRFDNPGPTLGMAYEKLMYSRQPAGKMVTESSINAITRKDLIALHRTLVSPENMILGMSGSFNRDTMKVRLERLLTNDTTTHGAVSFPKVSINHPVRTLFIHKPISQAYVRLGLPLFQRPHPDYYAMVVLNEILGGGGFASRLTERIRSDEGLTYSIYSRVESNYTYPGTFYVDFFTKNENFTYAWSLALTEIRKIIQTGVTDEELSNAKLSLLGELPSMFRSPDDIVTTYAWNEYYHRAQDHFRVYPEKIRKLTKNDLLRVAQTYLKPDSMTITVVGDSTALLHQKTGDISLNAYTPHIINPDSIPALP